MLDETLLSTLVVEIFKLLYQIALVVVFLAEVLNYTLLVQMALQHRIVFLVQAHDLLRHGGVTSLQNLYFLLEAP